MRKMNKTTGFLCGAAALGAISMNLTALSAESATRPHQNVVVETLQGKVQGRASKGALSFLGIPYGADTAGQNRFLAPQPAKAWSGIKKADHFGDRCPQPMSNLHGEVATVMQFSDLPMSENCLVLNVWTPRVHDHGKRPVMVWLHGGGFQTGTGGEKYYEGSNLSAKNDVVVVTLNHRLGRFGYLYLGPEAGPKYAGSNLAGMLDIVQALHWVEDNIGKFGGDPGNVTIFGESGGGAKVSVLLAMPAAQGLFHKAIIESGAAVQVGTIEDAAAARDKLLHALNLKSIALDKLQSLPMQDVIAASADAGMMAFAPVVDGDLLPAQPFSPLASPLSARVPILVGSAKDEATIFFLGDPTWQTMSEQDLLKKVAVSVGAERADQVLAVYRSDAPQDKPMHLWSSIATDQMFTHNSIVLAERKAAQHAAPVYMYKIGWDTPVLSGKLRAPHGVDLPFVFDNVDVAAGLVGAGANQDKMAQLMSRTFAAFARTGNPNVKGYPHWPVYTLEKRETYIYDIPPHVVSDPNSDRRKVWEEQSDGVAMRPSASAVR
jgi:para-nitrobenzyl esterase